VTAAASTVTICDAAKVRPFTLARTVTLGNPGATFARLAALPVTRSARSESSSTSTRGAFRPVDYGDVETVRSTLARGFRPKKRSLSRYHLSVSEMPMLRGRYNRQEEELEGFPTGRCTS
jgi:hypothetical protein